MIGAGLMGDKKLTKKERRLLKKYYDYQIKKYLLSHEDDIAHYIDDFGDLRGLFVFYIRRVPNKL